VCPFGKWQEPLPYFAARHRGHGSRHRRAPGSAAVSSPIADAKNLIVSSHGTLNFHPDLAPAHDLPDGPMLDLERLDRLPQFRRAASDPDPGAQAQVSVGEPNTCGPPIRV
jgi:hypothetical protein